MEQELRKQLRKYSKIFREAQEKGKKEADVVMYLVQFFKDVLGFDIFKEISKEYQIKGKYCDVAIKLEGQVEILVEAKQPGVRLADRHIEQAEVYAMKSGTRWVILTNGCDWKLFHLSYDEEGGIDSTLVFKTDLLKSFKEKPHDVIDKFKVLHKRNYKRGELDKYWQKKTMLIPLSLAKALFTEDVLKAIGREVNRGKDVKVGIEDISKALKNMFDKEVLADMADIKIKKRRKRKQLDKKGNVEPHYTGKTPYRIKVLGFSCDVKNWRDVLINVAETILKQNPKAFNKLPDSELMKGKRRIYLSKNKNVVYYPKQLSNGIYIDTNLSAVSIVRLADTLLEGCGYKKGDLKIFTKD
jgi:predicted type IV restriction endonuclease